MYNPGIAKFLSVDPLSPSYPWYTPYQFAGNKPIWARDLDGLEEEPYWVWFYRQFGFEIPNSTPDANDIEGLARHYNELDAGIKRRERIEKSLNDIREAQETYVPFANYYWDTYDLMEGNIGSWEYMGRTTLSASLDLVGGPILSKTGRVLGSIFGVLDNYASKSINLRAKNVANSADDIDVGSAWMENDVLKLDFDLTELKKAVEASGEEAIGTGTIMFNSIFQYFGGEKSVRAIGGKWMTSNFYPRGMSDNLIEFNKYFTDNNILYPKKEDWVNAARSVWTGRRAKSLGYTNVNFKRRPQLKANTTNQYSEVIVEFTQP